MPPFVPGMATPPAADPLHDALAALAQWLDAAGVSYALIGGLAVSLQAEPRFTEDVDAVIWVDDQRWPDLLRVAAAYGIAPRRHDALEFAQRSRVLLLEHASGVRLDVSCGALPFERDLVEQAETVAIGATTVRVARPDRLIVMKAVANRPKDWADIEALLEAHPTVALERIRLVVAEFADALEMPEILSRFDDVASRHRP